MCVCVCWEGAHAYVHYCVPVLHCKMRTCLHLANVRRGGGSHARSPFGNRIYPRSHPTTHPQGLHDPGPPPPPPVSVWPRSCSSSGVRQWQRWLRRFVSVPFHSDTQTAAEAFALLWRAYMNKNDAPARHEYRPATEIKTTVWRVAYFKAWFEC